jgi:3-dehydroquinate dehydratase-2
MNVLVLHGPNLNLLGTREPAVYGSVTLPDIDRELTQIAKEAGSSVQSLQSNHEGVLIDRVHAARTSIALRDAFAAVAIPFVEVHLSNIHRREPFRHHSYFSDLAEGVIVGLGAQGYSLALKFALARAPARN